MAIDNESFNRDLYDLLKVRGYQPVPLDSKNQRVPASQAADVIQFTFNKDGEDYGKVWVSIDDAANVIVYYDEEQQESPSNSTPGVEYDDSWTGFLKHLKNWSQRRQLSFELSNKDRLGDDMRQRDYYKMKERVSEGKEPTEKKRCGKCGENTIVTTKKGWMCEKCDTKKVDEGYHPMGKKASYNDAVPSVKIILQHNRALEEGEQRYRNVAKIFLENQDGERFLAPTTRPGIARVYARHIAEGGVPNDDRWNHVKSVVEDYNKMAGFVRATRNNQFNESAQELVNEGINHYNNLRETLSKLAGHRGYQAYFESWTPTLMEDDSDDLSINELFVQETVDPRIESAMPILSRLKKPVTEMEEVDTLAEWADGIINEKLDLDEEQVSEVLDTRDAKMSYAKKNMDSHKKALGDYMHYDGEGQDADKKADAHKTAMKRVRGLQTFVKNKVSKDEDAVEESGLQAYLGKKKYGEKGMKALQQAGRDGASKEKMATIRAKHDKLDEISKKTIKSYRRKAGDELDSLENQLMGSDLTSPEGIEAEKKAARKFDNRLKGLQTAKMKMSKPPVKVYATNEETVDEGKGATTFKRIDDYADWHDDYVMRMGAEYDETNLEGQLLGVARTNAGVRGIWYNKQKFGTISSTTFEDEVEYIETDPNSPWLNEGLDANQKRVGQLGPTEKVKNNNIGKLVGASESTEIDPELARIMEMARFKR